VLDGLDVGDVWLPGKTGWVAAEPALNVGLLAPALSQWGLPVRAVGGRTVLGADAVFVHEELESSMSQEESELERIVGELPLVVRLEVGALEMSAAEWAALRPGDVVQTGRRLEDPVILRAGGHEIARGELVDVEGEVGVRITQVGAVRTTP
jgi:flagellar motor switch/type III secretory pathway protein FliN